MAKGRSLIHGALASLDARSTGRVLRQLGVEVGPLTAGRTVALTGRGRFRAPPNALHCGNSGTTARLVLGLLAAHPFRSALTGDRSLRRRPMRRVTEPLGLMGARFSPPLADHLPLEIRGGPLTAIRWRLPVSSAQLKSALLLAGMAGDVGVAVQEPAGLSRDHTERMLRGLGFSVVTRDDWIVLEAGGHRLHELDLGDWKDFRSPGAIQKGDVDFAAFDVALGKPPILAQLFTGRYPLWNVKKIVDY